MTSPNEIPKAKHYGGVIPQTFFRGAESGHASFRDSQTEMGCVQFTNSFTAASDYTKTKRKNGLETSVYECKVDGGAIFAEFASEDEITAYGKPEYMLIDVGEAYRRTAARLLKEGFNGFVNLRYREFGILPLLQITIVKVTPVLEKL